ncbi:hypothetical protein M1D30_12005 [Prevotella sp. E15-22]|uniref:hypothetical protein n=1 Tax=Prevotella sp. E15-22 TaxID=2937774 RepID=UPI0020490A89|nr:hypothetical protein [Prevotella sp. E15-22]UPS44274.1 hypothetical protein M1D30_12005 [Prevotella sp. E15-22]
MKKISILIVAMLCMALNIKAGGLMTNTNYHIAFDRMMARGASFDIDATFSNPAGLAWGHEGWQLSLNFQKPWQNRDIELTGDATAPDFFNKKYPGRASAPIVPALFLQWAVSNSSTCSSTACRRVGASRLSSASTIVRDHSPLPCAMSSVPRSILRTTPRNYRLR